MFQYSAWLFFICVFQTDFCTIFTSFAVRAAQPRVPHSVYCTMVSREITFISTFLSTLCTTCKVSLTFHLFKISSVFPLSAKMSLTLVILYTPHPTLWSTTWCYLSAHQRQVQSHSTTTSTVKESSMSCFSTNNPITLYNHFITISAGSEHLTSFLYQTSLSTPEKVYQSTQIN